MYKFLIWDICALTSAASMTTHFWPAASQRHREHVEGSRNVSGMCCFGREGEGVVEKQAAQVSNLPDIGGGSNNTFESAASQWLRERVERAQRCAQHIPDVGGGGANIFRSRTSECVDKPVDGALRREQPSIGRRHQDLGARKTIETAEKWESNSPFCRTCLIWMGEEAGHNRCAEKARLLGTSTCGSALVCGKQEIFEGEAYIFHAGGDGWQGNARERDHRRELVGTPQHLPRLAGGSESDRCVALPKDASAGLDSKAKDDN
ncbi:hypothetical protein R3P38DRAFT_2786371 [Favolaschia claudopus]|uniref:Uncharacterized protein n=1 Tax=Favolaschia claudopus TaxID=2862362 RepID=A0AAW0ASF1_9AGAR